MLLNRLGLSRGQVGWCEHVGVVARLADVDPSQRAPKKEALERLDAAQHRMLRLRLTLGGQLGGGLGPPLSVLFEGWDASGKGGAIS